ncbi:MAG: metal-sensitive transcriptional regulator [Anaerolineae bacterium]|nr:metal-sensitive transcriptional regulator [Anaerolineae bacterium]
MGVQDPEVRNDLLRRLRRIEGQTRGVARMIEEGRDCQDVLQQLSAIRAAVHKTSVELMRSFAFECIQTSEEAPQEVVDALIKALSRVV